MKTLLLLYDIKVVFCFINFYSGGAVPETTLLEGGEKFWWDFPLSFAIQGSTGIKITSILIEKLHIFA